MHAVIAGRPDIVFALLDAGAHHDIKDHNVSCAKAYPGFQACKPCSKCSQSL